MTNPGDHGDEPKSEDQPSHEPQPSSTPPAAPGESGYPPPSPPAQGGYPHQGGYQPPQGGYQPPQGHPAGDVPPGGYPPPGYDPSGYGAPSYPPPPQYGIPAGGYPPPPPAYSSGYDPYSGGYSAPQQGTNTMAIGSLIASIVSLPLMFLCFTGDLAAIVGIVLGILAINQINRAPQNGRGLAIAGIAIGVVALLLSVVIVAAARRAVWTSYQ